MPTEITHTTRLVWTGTGGLDLSGTVAKTANAEQNRILALAAATPDQEFDLDFPFAKLESIFMLSTVDCTIKTNNGGAPDDTIILKANVPAWWAADSGVANPFTVDVTKIYVTVAGAVVGQLDVRILYDATP